MKPPSGYRAGAVRHCSWESIRATGAGKHIFPRSAPVAVFPATVPLPLSRSVRTSVDQPPTLLHSCESVRKLAEERPCDRPYPRGHRIDRLVQPSLSPVARSGASQPFQAVFLDSSSITGLLPLSAPRTGQGSFPPLALSSFIGTTNPSVIRIRRCWPFRVRRWSEVLTPHHGCGLPLLHTFHLPHVPPSLPRWDNRLRVSLASPVTSAFPVIMAGRLPHLAFRGLLDVYSRCSPRGPLVS